MRIINLFGEPGAGKSTIAAGLFYLMKIHGYEVELVTEFAKDLTWSERYIDLNDQLMVTANQHNRIHRLKKKVDYIITDSPIIAGILYYPKDYFPSYVTLLQEIHHSYNNTNILLKRIKKYNKNGRNQTEKQAKEKRKILKKLLEDNDIKYEKIESSKKAAKKIYKYLKKENII